MTTIADATIEQLEAEIRKRTSVSSVPEPLRSPDFSELHKMVVEGVNESHAEQYEDEDFKHYVYEAAMIAVYGKNFFTWRNSQRY